MCSFNLHLKSREGYYFTIGVHTCKKCVLSIVENVIVFLESVKDYVITFNCNLAHLIDYHANVE